MIKFKIKLKIMDYVCPNYVILLTPLGLFAFSELKILKCVDLSVLSA